MHLHDCLTLDLGNALHYIGPHLDCSYEYARSFYGETHNRHTFSSRRVER